NETEIVGKQHAARQNAPQFEEAQTGVEGVFVAAALRRFDDGEEFAALGLKCRQLGDRAHFLFSAKAGERAKPAGCSPNRGPHGGPPYERYLTNTLRMSTGSSTASRMSSPRSIWLRCSSISSAAREASRSARASMSPWCSSSEQDRS